MSTPDKPPGIVLVARCVDAPEPYVPSREVACSVCAAPCWLSLATGAKSVALAEQMAGSGHVFVCLPCIDAAVAAALGSAL